MSNLNYKLIFQADTKNAINSVQNMRSEINQMLSPPAIKPVFIDVKPRVNIDSFKALSESLAKEVSTIGVSIKPQINQQHFDSTITGINTNFQKEIKPIKISVDSDSLNSSIKTINQFNNAINERVINTKEASSVILNILSNEKDKTAEYLKATATVLSSFTRDRVAEQTAYTEKLKAETNKRVAEINAETRASKVQADSETAMLKAQSSLQKAITNDRVAELKAETSLINAKTKALTEQQRVENNKINFDTRALIAQQTVEINKQKLLIVETIRLKELEGNLDKNAIDSIRLQTEVMQALFNTTKKVTQEKEKQLGMSAITQQTPKTPEGYLFNYVTGTKINPINPINPTSIFDDKRFELSAKGITVAYDNAMGVLERRNKLRLEREEFDEKSSYNKRLMDLANTFAQMDSIRKKHELNYQNTINKVTGISDSSYQTVINSRGIETQRPKQNDYAMRDAMYTSLFTTVIDDDIKKLAQLEQANKKVTQSQRQLTQSTVEQTNVFTELHRWLSRSHDMLIRMAAYRVINFLASVPMEILRVNVEMENLMVRLEGITGSAEKAKRQFEDLLTLDLQAPFDIEGLATASTMMQNYGLTVQNVTEHNKALGNTLTTNADVLSIFADQTARLGGSTDTLTGIVRQFSQAWAKGKLQMQDARPMIERGVNVWDIAARAVQNLETQQGRLNGTLKANQQAIKRTTSDMLEMSRAGTLNKDVQAEMLRIMRVDFAGESLKQMDKLGGSLSNIKTGMIQLYNNMLDEAAAAKVSSGFQSIGTAILFLADSLKSTSRDAQIVFDFMGNSANVLFAVLGIKLVGSMRNYAQSLIPAATNTRNLALAQAGLATQTRTVAFANATLTANTTWATRATGAFNAMLLPMSRNFWLVNTATRALSVGVKLLTGAAYVLLAYDIGKFVFDWSLQFDIVRKAVIWTKTAFQDFLAVLYAVSKIDFKEFGKAWSNQAVKNITDLPKDILNFVFPTAQADDFAKQQTSYFANLFTQISNDANAQIAEIHKNAQREIELAPNLSTEQFKNKLTNAKEIATGEMEEISARNKQMVDDIVEKWGSIKEFNIEKKISKEFQNIDLTGITIKDLPNQITDLIVFNGRKFEEGSFAEKQAIENAIKLFIRKGIVAKETEEKIQESVKLSTDIHKNMVDNQLKDINRVKQAKLDSYEIDRENLEYLAKQGSISPQNYLNSQLELNRKIWEEKRAALIQERELIQENINTQSQGNTSALQGIEKAVAVLRTIESSNNPYAISNILPTAKHPVMRHAIGSMQTLPSTAKMYGVDITGISDTSSRETLLAWLKQNDNALKVEAAGVRYYIDIVQKTRGDFAKAAGLYNAGDSRRNVERINAGDMSHFLPETINHIAKFNNLFSTSNSITASNNHLTSESIKLRGDLADKNAELAKIDVEYHQANTKAIRESNQLTIEYGNDVNQLKIKYAELTGNTAQSVIETAKFSRATDDLLKSARSRGDNAVVDMINAINTIDPQLADIQEKIKYFGMLEYQINLATAAEMRNIASKGVDTQGQPLTDIGKTSLTNEATKRENLGLGQKALIDKELTSNEHLIAFREELNGINQEWMDMSLNISNVGDAFNFMNEGLGGVISALNSAMTGYAGVNNEIEKNKINEIKAVEQLNNRQISLEEFWQKHDAYTKTGIKLEQKQTSLSIQGARQITGAVGNMFSENSKARQAFHILDMTLGAVELANNIANNGALMASNLMAIGSNLAEGASKIWSQMGIFAPIGLAAMAASMGAWMIGNFTGGGSARIPEQTKSTGTVLGDSTASSESITRIVETLKDIHADEYPELRGIHSSMTALANSLQTTVNRGFTTGQFNTPNVDTSLSFFDKMQMQYLSPAGLMSLGISSAVTGLLIPAAVTAVQSAVAGSVITAATTGTTTFASSLLPILGFDPTGVGFVVGAFLGILDALFTDVETNINKQQLVLRQKSLGGIQSGGVSGVQETELRTVVSTLFYDSVYYKTVTQSLNKEFTSALTDVFNNAGNAVKQLGKALGTDLTAQVNSYVIPEIRLDVLGKKGEDISKELTQIMSATLDNMTNQLLGGLVGQYQKVGEGIMETAARVAVDVAVVKDALSTSQRQLSENAIAISESIVSAFGGAAELANAVSSFRDNFYTDAEKQAYAYKTLSESFKEVYRVVPATREEYKKLVYTFDVTTEWGRKQWTVFMQLNGIADQYYDTLKDGLTVYESAVKDTFAEVESAWQDIVSTIKSQWDSANSLATAQINKYKQIEDSLKAFSVNLLTNNAMNPMAEYYARQAQFNALQTDIQGTDKVKKDAALAQLPTVGQAFLTSSQSINKGGVDYLKDFARVNALTAQGINYAKNEYEPITSLLEEIKTALSDKGIIAKNTDSAKKALDDLEKSLTDFNGPNEAYKNAKSTALSTGLIAGDTNDLKTKFATLATAISKFDTAVGQLPKTDDTKNYMAFQQYELDRQQKYDSAKYATASGFASKGSAINKKLESTVPYDFAGSRMAYTASFTSNPQGNTVSNLTSKSWAFDENKTIVESRINARLNTVASSFNSIIDNLYSTGLSGVLPAFSVNFDQPVSVPEGQPHPPPKISYSFGSYKNSVTQGDLNTLSIKFMDNAIDLLAAQFPNQIISDKLKALSVGSIDSTLSEVSKIMTDYKTPFKQGVYNKDTDYLKLDGSHAGGLDYVPYDGYIAELHKGERVLTEKENKSYDTGLGTIFQKNTVGNTPIYYYTIDNKAIDSINKNINSQLNELIRQADLLKQGNSGLSLINNKQSINNIIMQPLDNKVTENNQDTILSSYFPQLPEFINNQLPVKSNRLQDRNDFFEYTQSYQNNNSDNSELIKLLTEINKKLEELKVLTSNQNNIVTKSAENDRNGYLREIQLLEKMASELTSESRDKRIAKV